jgi:hypothetical protein
LVAAASVAALACLGACSDDRDVAQDTAPAAPTASAQPTTLDPFAWTDVPYSEYLDAAEQIGLRPDVLMPEAGFSTGLNTLCHTTPADFMTLRKSQMSKTEQTDTYTTAKYLGDEVGLRIGLACPQRMVDWSATSEDQMGGDDSADDVSAVTDEELARAEADEAAASSRPDYDHGEASTTSTGGVTTGNGTAER